MNIPETFYIALCVTILMLGIVYWFWTQVQYLQRKVNLLDNVVYEMKTFISNLPGTNTRSGNTIEPVLPSKETDSPVQTAYNPPPESVAGDLEAERLASMIEFEPFSGESAVETAYAAPPESNEGNERNEGIDSESVSDDLQPGGLASASSSNTKKVEVFSDSALESPLSSMSLKELRRMAEANNIPGSQDLKKRELIKALRDKVGQIIGNEQQEKVLSFDDIGAPGSD